MKSLINYIGVIIELLGVVVLAIYSTQTRPANTLLIVALAIILVGIVAQVILNKIK